MKRYFLSIVCMMLSLAAFALSDGTYYLYNVGAGMYLDHGGSDNYHACLKPHGAPIQIAGKGSDLYTLKTSVDKTAYLASDGTVYTNTSGENFTIKQIDNGNYTIQTSAGKYVGFSGTKAQLLSQTTVVFSITGELDANAEWQILSKADLEARFEGATAEKPVDATFYLYEPNFNRHGANLKQWSNYSSTTTGYCSNYLYNNCGYYYGTSTTAAQTISGLKPGVYKLKAQGVYCHGAVASVATSYTTETMPKKAVLFAGDVEQPLMGILEQVAPSNIFNTGQAVSGGFIPTLGNTDSNDAVIAFDNGMYTNNELTFIVGAEGTVTLGVKLSGGIDGSWAAYDNFELFYLGNLTEVTEEQVNALVASVPTDKMSSAVSAQLASAVDALKANPTADNYNAAVDAVKAARESIEAYALVKAAIDKANETTLSEEARAQYEAAVASVLSAYEEGTIEGNGQAEAEAIEAALKEAVRSDISKQNNKTALIVNPQFDEGTTGWSGDFGPGAKKGLASNYVITAYGGGFDIYQTIEGLTPGIYKLQVQAFTRPDSNTNTWNAYKNGEELENLTYIYANDASKKVKFIIDEYLTTKGEGNWTDLGDGKYIPDNSSAFSVAFSAGLYDNELICIVGDDGMLKIGIKNESTSSVTYAGFDNFRLSYVGSTDCTGLIVNPQFNDGTAGWSGDFGSGAKKGLASNYVITAYGGSFNIYQTIEGLTPGTYKLQVQAFSRPDSNTNTWNAYKNGQAIENMTYIYANDASQLVKLIIDDYMTSTSDGNWTTLESGKYIPDNSTAFSVAFSAGLYDNELICTVGEDGKLTLGIRNESNTSVTYAGYDNFRLTYISSEVNTGENIYEEATKLIEGYNLVAAQATDHAAFDAVATAALATLAEGKASTKEVDALVAEVKAAFMDILKNGSTATGQFDFTSLIANNTFDTNANGWTSDGGNLKWMSPGMVEIYNVMSGDKVYQELKGLPAGHYTLMAQTFYRPRGTNETINSYEYDLEDDNSATMFLGEASKPVINIMEDGRYKTTTVDDVPTNVLGRGFPKTTTMANELFGFGHYWNILEVDVAEDGDLTLGFELQPTTKQYNWIAIDNVKLLYGQPTDLTLSTGIAYKATQPVLANVTLNKSFAAGQFTPLAVPFDVPKGVFKEVYEVGSAIGTDATLYPVDHVKANMPCVVVAENDMENLHVDNVWVMPTEPDQVPVTWDGGIIIGNYKDYDWKVTNLNNTSYASSKYTFSIAPSESYWYFTANIENYKARKYLTAARYTQTSASIMANYVNAAPARRDIPRPVVIPVSVKEGAKTAYVKYNVNTSGELPTAKNRRPAAGADEGESMVQYFRPSQGACYIANLIPGNTYSYQVVVDDEEVAKGDFAVEGPLRMIYAPSVYNMRDLGGWTTDDGKTVRYGLVYRGGEVNGTHPATEADLDYLKKVVGIGAELDLRWKDGYDKDRETNISGYHFVHGDTYYFAGANDYLASDLNNAETQARVKEEFEYLLGHIKEGRGVHFHCVWGADRTGFFAFLLEGLLGMSLAEMYEDYEFTSFAPAGTRVKSSIQERIAVIQALSGATLKEKFENYFLNKLKVPQEEIDLFRSIMLVDPQDVGINDIQIDQKYGKEGSAEVKSVYSISGAKLQPSALKNNTLTKGAYVVQYTDGTVKKLFIK